MTPALSDDPRASLPPFKPLEPTDFLLPRTPLYRSKLKPCPTPLPYFTGREDALQRMASYFESELDEDSNRVFVLYGPPGSGKTEIAYEYIRRNQHLAEDWSSRISTIFVIDASSQQSIVCGWGAIAHAAQLEGRMDVVIRWMASLHDPWLLFLDNATDASLDIANLPHTGKNGSIIVTTRDQEVVKGVAAGAGDAWFHVSCLPMEDALSLLSRVCPGDDEDEAKLREALVTKLGFLPLPIRLAGSAIKFFPLTLSDYLKLVDHDQDSQPAELTHPSVGDEPPPLYTNNLENVWNITVNRLRTAASDLLVLCALMHHRDIPLQIFRSAAEHMGTPRLSDPPAESLHTAFKDLEGVLSSYKLPGETWDQAAFDTEISDLHQLGLIQVAPSFISLHGALSVFKLPHSRIQSKHAEVLLAASLKEEDVETLDFPYRAALSLHVSSTLCHLAPETAEPSTVALFSPLFVSVNLFSQAEAISRSLVAREEAQHGAAHPTTMKAKLLLASVLEAQEKWDQCHALASDILIGGVNDAVVDTFRTTALVVSSLQGIGKLEEARECAVNFLKAQQMGMWQKDAESLLPKQLLASALKNLGRLREARAVELEILEAQSNELGPDHPSTLFVLYQLALSCSLLGEWSAARDGLRTTLQGRSRVLGDQHKDTLETQRSLVQILGKLGEWKESKIVAEKLLEYRTAALGPEHLDVFNSKSDLADTLLHLGQLNKSRNLAQQAAEGLQQLLGPRHASALDAQLIVARVLVALGRWEDSRKLCVPLVQWRSERLGHEHRDTLQVMETQAYAMNHVGRAREARQIAERIFDIRHRVSGPGHPDTLCAMHLVAVNLGTLGHWEACRNIISNVVDIRCRVAGQEHPTTLSAQSYLAFALMNLRETDEANRIASTCRDAQSRVLGPSHPDTLETMHVTSCILGNMGKWEEASELCRKNLDTRENVLGRQHPDTMNSMFNLSVALHKLRRLQNAATMASQTVERYQEVYGAKHPFTMAARARLEAIEEDSGSSSSSWLASARSRFAGMLVKQS